MLIRWLMGKRVPPSGKAPSRKLELEPLEERRLFAVSITEFATGGTTSEIARGSDGNLWFTEPNRPAIGRITPSGTVTEFTSLPANSSPIGIAAGNDGNIWFTDAGTNKIGRITTSVDHTITEFPLGSFLNSSPLGITAGPSTDPNSLWFTKPGTGQTAGEIGRISTIDGTISEFNFGFNNSPFWITSGSDNALWFTDQASNQIERYDPSGRSFSSFPINASPFRGLDHITSGPDGAIWFTEASHDALGRIDVSTHSVSEFGIPVSGSPSGITTGPDGNLWFTERAFNQGQITSFAAVNAAPDMIGRFVPGAQNNASPFTMFNVPTTNAGPQGITAGPNNTLWFAETTQDQVGRVDLGSHGPVVTGTQIDEVQGHRCTDVVATFTDVDTGETQSNFTVGIDWGDGTPLDTTTGTVAQTGTSGAGNTYTVSGTHSYATKGNFTITVTVHDNADAVDGQATSSASVLSGNEAFVRALYRDVLLRVGDGAGVASWTNDLDAGLMTRGQVADGITTSSERRGLEVDQDYHSVLGRDADPLGRAHFVGELNAHVSEGRILIEMFLSQEYALKHDNLAFVQDLYRVVLERTGSSSEVMAWVQVLNAGALSRDQVATLFLSSKETYSTAINQNYGVFLRRAPDAGGFGLFFAGILNNTVTSVSLSDSILGSQEYFDLNINNC